MNENTDDASPPEPKICIPSGSELHRVGVKVPPFYAEKPAVWFKQLEGQFKLAGIKTDETKFYYASSQLHPPYVDYVDDIIENPPEANMYEKLKSELIKRLTKSKEKKVLQLLTHEELGDRKPSYFLRHLQQLAGPGVPDDFIKTIWSSRLPSSTQAIIAAQPSTALEVIAELADRVHDVVPTYNCVAEAARPLNSAANHQVASTSQMPQDSMLDVMAKQIVELTKQYLGSFPVAGVSGGGAGAGGAGGASAGDGASADKVARQLQLMKENGRAVPVLVVVALSGVKICRPHDQSVRMAHALRRISYATCEGARALFAFVARAPKAVDAHYCHAFATDTPQQAEELNALVGDAFRMAFASQLQTSAPIWTKELSVSGADNRMMGVRAPDSLPGLTRHYPHCIDRSSSQCDLMGAAKLIETSPSSSEESPSPSEGGYRRLGERQPLMKRIAMGFSGALLQPSDDDSTPLVTDTPTTPINMPLCLNGGYINEASEVEVRTRESNRESPARPATLRPNHDSIMHELDEFKKNTNHVGKNCAQSATCSRATSSSSGASSCVSSRSGNNNLPPPPVRLEPALRQAPWFQAGIPREIALEVLNNQPVGAFMVRCSTTQNGCFALSVRVPRDFQPSGIAHYLILRTPKGYKIKGFTKEFSTLTALVTHHSVMPELLPCPLWLARYNPSYARRDHADLDTIADPDYSKQDFSPFMCELDV